MLDDAFPLKCLSPSSRASARVLWGGVMRRSPRVVVAWFMAALVAVATIRIVATDLGTLHRRAQALGSDVNVLVATRDLPLGHSIADDDLRDVARPASTVARDSIRDRVNAIGHVVVVPLLRDDVMRAGDLAPATRTGLDAVIPVGARALHVVTKDGFRPPTGAIVDVYAAFDPGSGAGPPSALRAARVASAATVISVDALDQSEETGAGGVTLLVTEGEAAAVAFAASYGQLTLALAPPESACCRSPGTSSGP
jgi:Flp pilus assembly protein CpaB